ncbi:MAG: hypothetical protein RBT37_02090 [Dissulfurispiraceae bacterium]|jgi:hypothetical protein|nr:hypothetical protein [Dissulfurispiraceae bacterium]
MKELFNGVAVIIDDEIDDLNANICNIIKQIESKKLPVLKYTSLPEDDVVSHFQNLSFLLLDWKLIKNDVISDEIEKAVRIPDTHQEYETTENIEFIKKLNEKCFCPIFIFTNEDTASIQDLLIEHGLIVKDNPSNLFVQSKSNLQDNLFNKVFEWLHANPSVYVLKKWEREYQNCKTKLFSEFHTINPAWPTIIWKNFETDGANKSMEMGELISRNLQSRMIPFEFDNEILNKDSQVPKDELRKVLEGKMFLKSESLHDGDIGTGDLFKKKYEDGDQTKYRYYLNIRAQCDLVRNNDPELFVISGYVLEQNEKGKIKDISFNNGQYLEKPSHAIVAFVDDGKIIEFKFNEFSIEKWGSLNANRVGRLLPPYINRVQQRHALYIQRQGLPRIPYAAIFESNDS